MSIRLSYSRRKSSHRYHASDAVVITIHPLTSDITTDNPLTIPPFVDELPLPVRGSNIKLRAQCWAYTHPTIPGSITAIELGRLFPSYQATKERLVQDGEWNEQKEHGLDQLFARRVRGLGTSYRKSLEWRDILKAGKVQRRGSKAGVSKGNVPAASDQIDHDSNPEGNAHSALTTAPMEEEPEQQGESHINIDGAEGSYSSILPLHSSHAFANSIDCSTSSQFEWADSDFEDFWNRVDESGDQDMIEVKNMIDKWLEDHLPRESIQEDTEADNSVIDNQPESHSHDELMLHMGVQPTESQFEGIPEEWLFECENCLWGGGTPILEHTEVLL